MAAWTFSASISAKRSNAPKCAVSASPSDRARFRGRPDGFANGLENGAVLVRVESPSNASRAFRSTPGSEVDGRYQRGCRGRQPCRLAAEHRLHRRNQPRRRGFRLNGLAGIAGRLRLRPDRSKRWRAPAVSRAPGGCGARPPPVPPLPRQPALPSRLATRAATRKPPGAEDVPGATRHTPPAPRGRPRARRRIRWRRGAPRSAPDRSKAEPSLRAGQLALWRKRRTHSAAAARTDTARAPAPAAPSPPPQILIEKRLNPRRIRVHQQCFGGGRALRLVNLLGGFDGNLIFAVGDQLPDAGLRRRTGRRLLQSGRGGCGRRRPFVLSFVPHAVPGSFLLGGCYNYAWIGREMSPSRPGKSGVGLWRALRPEDPHGLQCRFGPVHRGLAVGQHRRWPEAYSVASG